MKILLQQFHAPFLLYSTEYVSFRRRHIAPNISSVEYSANFNTFPNGIPFITDETVAIYEADVDITTSRIEITSLRMLDNRRLCTSVQNVHFDDLEAMK